MAQTGYTPIQLYYSATPTNAPLNTDLVAGELALNTADGKLFYKDSSNVVQVLATKGSGPVGGSNTQVQFNNSGALGGSSAFTWNGTNVQIGTTTAISATNPLLAMTGTANAYIQSYVYNAGNTASGSADFVAYPNNGTDTHGWVDVGITSQSYADATYTVTGPNESYLFGSAPSGSGTTGNLVYATDNTGSENAHQFYVGGFTQSKNSWRLQIGSTSTTLKGSLLLSGSTSGTVGFQAAATAGSTTYTLPSADGSSGQALVTNGSGTLSWGSAGITTGKAIAMAMIFGF